MKNDLFRTCDNSDPECITEILRHLKFIKIYNDLKSPLTLLYKIVFSTLYIK